MQQASGPGQIFAASNLQSGFPKQRRASTSIMEPKGSNNAFSISGNSTNPFLRPPNPFTANNSSMNTEHKALESKSFHASAVPNAFSGTFSKKQSFPLPSPGLATPDAFSSSAPLLDSCKEQEELRLWAAQHDLIAQQSRHYTLMKTGFIAALILVVIAMGYIFTLSKTHHAGHGGINPPIRGLDSMYLATPGGTARLSTIGGGFGGLPVPASMAGISSDVDISSLGSAVSEDDLRAAARILALREEEREKRELFEMDASNVSPTLQATDERIKLTPVARAVAAIPEPKPIAQQLDKSAADRPPEVHYHSHGKAERDDEPSELLRALAEKQVAAQRERDLAAIIAEAEHDAPAAHLDSGVHTRHANHAHAGEKGSKNHRAVHLGSGDLLALEEGENKNNARRYTPKIPEPTVTNHATIEYLLHSGLLTETEAAKVKAHSHKDLPGVTKFGMPKISEVPMPQGKDYNKLYESKRAKYETAQRELAATAAAAEALREAAALLRESPHPSSSLDAAPTMQEKGMKDFSRAERDTEGTQDAELQIKEPKKTEAAEEEKRAKEVDKHGRSKDKLPLSSSVGSATEPAADSPAASSSANDAELLSELSDAAAPSSALVSPAASGQKGAVIVNANAAAKQVAPTVDLQAGATDAAQQTENKQPEEKKSESAKPSVEEGSQPDPTPKATAAPGTKSSAPTVLDAATRNKLGDVWKRHHRGANLGEEIPWALSPLAAELAATGMTPSGPAVPDDEYLFGNDFQWVVLTTLKNQQLTRKVKQLYSPLIERLMFVSDSKDNGLNAVVLQNPQPAFTPRHTKEQPWRIYELLKHLKETAPPAKFYFVMHDTTFPLLDQIKWRVDQFTQLYQGNFPNFVGGRKTEQSFENTFWKEQQEQGIKKFAGKKLFIVPCK
jgi:hypothetical protein